MTPSSRESYSSGAGSPTGEPPRAPPSPARPSPRGTGTEARRSAPRPGVVGIRRVRAARTAGGQDQPRNPQGQWPIQRRRRVAMQRPPAADSFPSPSARAQAPNAAHHPWGLTLRKSQADVKSMLSDHPVRSGLRLPTERFLTVPIRAATVAEWTSFCWSESPSVFTPGFCSGDCGQSGAGLASMEAAPGRAESGTAVPGRSEGAAAWLSSIQEWTLDDPERRRAAPGRAPDFRHAAVAVILESQAGAGPAPVILVRRQ